MRKEVKRHIITYVILGVLSYIIVWFVYYFFSIRYGKAPPTTDADKTYFYGLPFVCFWLASSIGAFSILNYGEKRERKGLPFFEHKHGFFRIIAVLIGIPLVLTVLFWSDIKDTDLFMKGEFSVIKHVKYLRHGVRYASARSIGTTKSVYTFVTAEKDTISFYSADSGTDSYKLSASDSNTYTVTYLPNTKRLHDIKKEK